MGTRRRSKPAPNPQGGVTRAGLRCRLPRSPRGKPRPAARRHVPPGTPGSGALLCATAALRCRQLRPEQRPGPKEPSRPLPAGVPRAAAPSGGPAGQVGAAPWETTVVGPNFLRMAARLKCAPSTPLILGVGGETKRRRVKEKQQGPQRPSRRGGAGAGIAPRAAPPSPAPHLPAAPRPFPPPSLPPVSTWPGASSRRPAPRYLPSGRQPRARSPVGMASPSPLPPVPGLCSNFPEPGTRGPAAKISPMGHAGKWVPWAPHLLCYLPAGAELPRALQTPARACHWGWW